jgi:alpha-tubulin suppressor-like RCC1 family protein
VRCWGANDWGQLGDGTYVDRPTPVQVVSLGAVTALAGGWAHTCAVSAGAPVCWGVDYRGELGHDTTYNRYVPARAGSVPGSSPAWSRIAAGGYQTCALDASGATYCWGTLESAHDFAELSYSPAAKAQGRQFIQIYDDAIQCGLEGDGELWCWDYRHEPVRFPGAGPIVDAAIAFSQVCALDAAGTVRCWDPISGGSIPGDVTGAPPLVSIAAASAQACGLSATGELWCWVPFGTIQGQATQARPATTGTTTQSFASVWDGSDRVCALTGTGDAWCSGGGFSPLPIAFTSFAAGFGFTTLASGEEHVCGLTATGAAWCWGSNDVGQVGDGTSTTRTTPVAVQGGHQFVEIAAGYAHTCARTGNGDAWCWGASGAGQIGDGTKWANPGPIGVTGATAAITVGSGGDFSCSLRPGGSAFCWPFLQPGSGDNVVAGPAPFVTLAVGGGHGCGLDAAGVASCWGSTSGGQLGDGRGGEGSSGPIPRPVLGGLHFASIASGLGGTTCGITLAGNTWCWGPNNTESLGSPDAAGTYASGIPVRVYGQE